MSIKRLRSFNGVYAKYIFLKELFSYKQRGFLYVYVVEGWKCVSNCVCV